MSALHSTARWKRRRARQLRHFPLCRLCLSLFGKLSVAVVADHVLPHRNDPKLFWNGELQSLCESCHNSLKQQQEQGGGMAGSYADGTPIDPAHPWNQ